MSTHSTHPTAHLFSTLALTVAAVLQQAALAADAPTTLPKIRVQSDSLESESYRSTNTITATRTDTPLRDVPQAVTVIGSDLISDQAMQSMADVLRYVPGITMGQGESNRDQPTIRGNATTADFFVDGVRDDAQYFRDVYNVERVEALKGPNAMIFGRGGGGGVINRVTKQASGTPVRAFTVQGGSYDNLRTTVDVGQGFGENFAVRLNGLYEDSESYRDHVDLERYGINPTMSLTLGQNTLITLGYEHFKDERTADRGVPSLNGEPLDTDDSTFFGDPDQSYSDVTVDAVNAYVEHEFAEGLVLRNRTRYAEYDKFYQNVFPGAVVAASSEVNISAYNNLTLRDNLFNQTDLVTAFDTGAVKHTLLVGAELGRQRTDNRRLTGFFNGTDTSIRAPLADPTISVPVSFRPNGTDGDNHVEVEVMSAYVQDQIQLTPQWQAIIGLRYDNFDIKYRDNRTPVRLSRKDDPVSPRVGLVYKPVEVVSLYASYSESFLPSSGDQFSSLTATTDTLEPEEFTNYEVGVKWDARDNLAVTAAVFQLERTNTTAPNPDPTGPTLQTGEQRTRGAELEIAGQILPQWSVFGGYAYQDAEITHRTSAALPGATPANSPKHKFSLWNRYNFTPMWGVGLGLIYQDDTYAAVDNSVTLPDFTRVDAGVFARFNDKFRAQLNIENLLDEEYFVSAHNNNNITPGSPTAVKVSFTAEF